MIKWTRPWTGAAAALVCAGTLAACGGGGGVTSDASTNGRKAGSGTAPATDLRHATFDPAEFGAPTQRTNEWLPLKPGIQWVRQGATDVGHRRVPHRVVSTVTDVSRTVGGVRAVAVLDQDVDAGQIAQESLDYFGTDKHGNVWDLGSYTEAYEGGRFVSVQDAWLAGVNGGEAGILMPADPTAAGSSLFSIATPPGEDGDVAQVVKSGQRHCVPLRCFDHVLVVREGKAKAPDNEFKYYAPGVGQIDNEPRWASNHRDVEKLVNVTNLSAKGLAELSKEALKLDHHASTTKPKVFDPAHKATRGL